MSMSLADVVGKLESFAPSKLAEKWDNVGLLIEPSGNCVVKNILLTNDLTEKVMDEAIEFKTNLIISYHPPIFTGMKRLTQSTWKERIDITCLENRIALYSPHTAWDCVRNGVNDWLANSLPISSSLPVIPNSDDSDIGAGRICKLKNEINLQTAINMIKAYSGLQDVRVGIASSKSMNSPINNFAVCAGSGASVLSNIKEPLDLVITGEMGHHEVLDLIHRGIHVITMNHSNSERGYLKQFSDILQALLCNEFINIKISEADKDPLSSF